MGAASANTNKSVHKIFNLCFKTFHEVFKSGRYANTRKAAEAVSRSLSVRKTSFLPLFFLFTFAKSPLPYGSGLFKRLTIIKFRFVALLHWRLRVNGFPRGEAVERSETDEECGLKCWILHLFAGICHSAGARRSSSDPAYAGPPSPRGKALRLRR